MSDSTSAYSGDARLAQQVTLWGSVRRHWWIVLATTILFVLLGIALAARQDVVYEATSGVIIVDPRAEDRFAVTGDGGLTNQASDRYLADHVQRLAEHIIGGGVLNTVAKFMELEW